MNNLDKDVEAAQQELESERDFCAACGLYQTQDRTGWAETDRGVFCPECTKKYPVESTNTTAKGETAVNLELLSLVFPDATKEQLEEKLASQNKPLDQAHVLGDDPETK